MRRKCSRRSVRWAILAIWRGVVTEADGYVSSVTATRESAASAEVGGSRYGVEVDRMVRDYPEVEPLLSQMSTAARLHSGPSVRVEFTVVPDPDSGNSRQLHATLRCARPRRELRSMLRDFEGMHRFAHRREAGDGDRGCPNRHRLTGWATTGWRNPSPRPPSSLRRLNCGQRRAGLTMRRWLCSTLAAGERRWVRRRACQSHPAAQSGSRAWRTWAGMVPLPSCVQA